MTDATGSLSDGSGSALYGNNANCKWIIAPPGASEVTITFTEFSTESCCDFVRVWQCTDLLCSSTGPPITSLQGNYGGPKRYTASTGYMMVQFTTDSSITSSGFSATWTSGVGNASSTPAQVSHTHTHWRTCVTDDMTSHMMTVCRRSPAADAGQGAGYSQALQATSATAQVPTTTVTTPTASG